ncbi:phosphatase [Streptomyces sp. SM14]|uniref:phosphatase n=1 Tax=Streptomyces sp. SM14 TaxID=1736045 RepID=UPI000CD4CEBA|nr:phosphatase [Streptomyces sp. SM14]
MLSAGALRAHLLATRLAGPVGTSRERSLRRYRLFAAREPRALTGIEPEGDWPFPRVLELMAARCGVSADPRSAEGADTIDPDRTLRALDRFAAHLARAVRDRAPVLLGTGRPRALLPFYADLAEALSAAGCAVLTPGEGRSVDITTRFGLRLHRLMYVRGVAVARPVESGRHGDSWGETVHSALPARVALGALADGGGVLPGLVVGDRGWLCAAAQAGFTAVGVAGADAPAAFVGEAEGSVGSVVPMDDGVYADSCLPLTRYVLNKVHL